LPAGIPGYLKTRASKHTTKCAERKAQSANFDAESTIFAEVSAGKTHSASNECRESTE